MEAHGSISDFNWQSRAHPCEHTHKSADALQLELKHLEKKQPPHLLLLAFPAVPSQPAAWWVTPQFSPLSRWMKPKGKVYPVGELTGGLAFRVISLLQATSSLPKGEQLETTHTCSRSLWG